MHIEQNYNMSPLTHELKGDNFCVMMDFNKII